MKALFVRKKKHHIDTKHKPVPKYKRFVNTLLFRVLLERWKSKLNNMNVLQTNCSKIKMKKRKRIKYTIICKGCKAESIFFENGVTFMRDTLKILPSEHFSHSSRIKQTQRQIKWEKTKFICKHKTKLSLKYRKMDKRFLRYVYSAFCVFHSLFATDEVVFVIEKRELSLYWHHCSMFAMFSCRILITALVAAIFLKGIENMKIHGYCGCETVYDA